MRKYLLVAGVSAAVIAATLATPVLAQYDAGKGEASKGTTTPQRQKLKDCAGKWKDEKAQKHVSGRDAYRAFMKECLSG